MANVKKKETEAAAPEQEQVQAQATAQETAKVTAKPETAKVTVKPVEEKLVSVRMLDGVKANVAGKIYNLKKGADAKVPGHVAGILVSAGKAARI